MSTTFPTSPQPPSSGSKESPQYVPLHLHTLYSPLGSTVRLPDLFQKCKERGFPSVAITDHGSLCGAIDFYKEGKKAGIRPIFGCDVYVQPPENIQSHNQSHRSAATSLRVTRLVLLAQNRSGYQALLRLISRAYLENFKGGRPLLDPKWLEGDEGKHLIAISGGLKSPMGWNVLHGDMERAAQEFEFLHRTFGDRFYGELQASHLSEMEVVNKWILKECKKRGVKPVATSNVHYLEKEEAASYDVLTCIKLGKNITDIKRRLVCEDFWLQDSKTMGDFFSHCPDALANTLEVADRCQVELEFSNDRGEPIYHLPTFEIPEEEKPTTLEEYLRTEAERGLKKRFHQGGIEEKTKYYDRLDVEVKMIQKTGFAGYFLIVYDFIRWAKSNGIPVGPGRGSGAGSLVAWALEITNIDPIPYNLLFERFINPERVSMPDFDVDFCPTRREEVIDYVKEKYGKENVSQIITFGRLQAKNCIRDVGRVLGMPYDEVDKIAKLVPDRLGIKLQEALSQEEKLQKLCDENSTVASLFHHALKLEGLIRNFGKHAGGVIITDQPITSYSPLCVDTDGNVMTQFDKDSGEMVGLVKFDFLGLKTLTQIENTLELINSDRKDPLSVENIIPDESAPFDLVSRGETIGIFQLESGGMVDLCKRIDPCNLDELAVISALYRPGPLESGMVTDFIERKHGRVPIEYSVQKLELILKETFGVIVYQEQVMRVAQLLAGYTLGEADILRRAMGKKKVKEMADQKERFVKGAREKENISEEISGAIFELIEKFAGYGFNKSHATAYAYISYQTAYLKHHYPAQFFAGLLTTDMSDTDRLAKIIGNAKESGVRVLGPDINESRRFFTVLGTGKDQKIRFGLEAIKSVGYGAVEDIQRERKENGPFHSLANFCSRISTRKVSRKTREALIQAGAFDAIHESVGSRKALFEALPAIINWGLREQEHKAMGQESLSFDTDDGPGLRGAEPEVKKIPDWEHGERLDMERSLMGFYVSGHPVEAYVPLIKTLTDMSIGSVQEKAATSSVFVPSPDAKPWQNRSKNEYTLVGLVTTFREIHTKKGQRMAFATMEDLSGKIEMICFPRVYEKFGEEMRVGKLIVARGNIEAKEKIAKILLSSVRPLAEYSEKERQDPPMVFFRLDSEQTTRGQLQALHDICRRHKGKSKAIIEYSMGNEVKAKMELPGDLKVSPGCEFINEVRRVFGADILSFH